MKYLTSIVFFICSILASYGQSVPFLNFFSDARTAAMGNAGYALSSPFSIHQNAAAIMPESDPEMGVALSYLLWQPNATNTNLLNVAGYLKHNNLGFMGGIRYHSLGSIEKTDDQGNAIGAFSPNEYTLELGLGYRLNSSVSLGMTLRHIGSQLDEDKKASAVAVDLSMLYNSDNFRIGVGMSNLGSKMEYGYSKHGLPTRIRTGLVYRFILYGKHALIGVADAAYQLTQNYQGIVSGIGAEYSYDNMIALRTGYQLESEAVGPSYASVGCGVHFSGFSLDLAFMLAQKNVPMRQTMIISLKWVR